MLLKKVKVTVHQREDFQVVVNETADCQSIVDAFAQNDLEISLDQSFILWQRISAEASAGWLILPDSSDRLWAILSSCNGEFWD